MAIGNDGTYFTVMDYTIFTSMLILSTFIGCYYGFLAKKKQNSTAEYLLGDKQMGLLPIAISLIVTHISGITMLGIPAEIYAFGTQFWLSFISALAISFSLKYIFYPVFYDLKLLSTFLYFEKRFNRQIRLVASAAYTCLMISFMPMLIYIPALAFNQVSGVNIHVVTTILCIVCVFYTAVGGLRAVVWTDTIQFLLMFGAIFAVIVLGILNLEHPLELFSIADEGHRIILFDFNPSPLVRSSVWTVIFGLSVYWCAGFGAAQSCIQKLLSIGDRKSAQKAIWIYGAGIICFNLTAVLMGIVIYANMSDCDPLAAGIVRKLDQVVPYFIMRIGSRIPGLPGLFIAGLFSGGLSSMSGGLNTISCTIYEDFLKNKLKNTSEKTISTILKIIVLVAGLFVLGLVFVVERLGTVFELAAAIYGVAGGAIIGLFSTGMLCRRINAKGAMCGAIASIILVATITIGAQSTAKPKKLPMRIDGCGALIANWNETIHHIVEQPILPAEDETFWLFRISFMYYTLIGCATVWIVSYSISLLTEQNEILDENVLAPFMRKQNIDDIDMKADKKIVKKNLTE